MSAPTASVVAGWIWSGVGRIHVGGVTCFALLRIEVCR
jgi:hypothetical protein